MSNIRFSSHRVLRTNHRLTVTNLAARERCPVHEGARTLVPLLFNYFFPFLRFFFRYVLQYDDN